MRDSHGQTLDVLQVGNRDGQRVGGCVVAHAELPVAVPSPAPHRVVTKHGAGVTLSTMNAFSSTHRGSVGAEHRGGADRARADAAAADPPRAIISSAPQSAIRNHGAAMMVPTTQRFHVVKRGAVRVGNRRGVRSRRDVAYPALAVLITPPTLHETAFKQRASVPVPNANRQARDVGHADNRDGKRAVQEVSIPELSLVVFTPTRHDFINKHGARELKFNPRLCALNLEAGGHQHERTRQRRPA